MRNTLKVFAALCGIAVSGLLTGIIIPVNAQDIGGQVNNPPVQGSGGGFDADMVDGHHASDFSLLSSHNVFTAPGTSQSAPIEIASDAPSLSFYETDGGVDEKAWDCVVNTSLFCRLSSDDDATTNVWLSVARIGDSPGDIHIQSASGDVLLTGLKILASPPGVPGVDMTPASGTFSGTVSDGVNSATGAFTYYKIGGLVSIVAQSAVAFVGTGSALSMTGFPAALRPSSPAYFMCPQVGGDGSTSYLGACRVHAAAEGVSQIDMGISVVSGATAALTVPNGGSSVSGQSKGVAAGWSITYTAN